MPLTETAIKNAKPGPKAVRLFDGKGLYLEVSPGRKTACLSVCIQRWV